MGDTNRDRSDDVGESGSVGRRALIRSIAAAGSAGVLGTAGGGSAAARSDAAQPSNLRATETSPTSISLAWDAPQAGGDVDRYEIWADGERSTDGGDPGFRRFDDSETTTETGATLDNLPPGFEFDVRVTVVRADGTEATAETTAATAAPTGEDPPATPSGRRLSADGLDVTLSWDPPSADDLSHYELRWIDYAPPGAGMPDTPVRRTIGPGRTSVQIPRGTDVHLLAVDEGGNASEPATVRVAEPVPQDGTVVRNESFTVTGEDGSPSNDASVELRPATNAVVVTGTIAAPNGCHRATANATFDGRVLSVTVGTVRDDETEVCTQAVRGIEYEASYELGATPVGAVVEHAGQDFQAVRGNVSAPARPTELTVDETSPGSATVSWTPVDADDLSHYVVARAPGRADAPADADGGTETPTPPRTDELPTALRFPPEYPWKSVVDGETTATFRDLESGTHTVGVQAVDVDGLRSPWAVGAGDGPLGNGVHVEPIDGTVPRDLDGDGLYEDLNRNGTLDYDDVATYFDNMDDPALTENVRYYDYNGNGEVDYDDLVTLFQQV